MGRVAIILSNLGGPDALDDVKPFLFNLFCDRHIIDLPNPFRYLLAKYISNKRTPFAKDIYRHLGGGSPILKNTLAQVKALKEFLLDQASDDYEVFVMMSYWHPFPSEVAVQVKNFMPDEVILLPLYPQYSTTNTLSCIDELNKYLPLELKKSFKIVCCYYDNPLFIETHCSLIRKHYQQEEGGNPRVLFSAHGLPVKTINKGDPYQYQVNESVRLIVKKLGIQNLDWKVCYQSKVGRSDWLEPSTEEEIKSADKQGKHVIIVPISFVSEHSETLVELDIEYKGLTKFGYTRVPTLQTDELFIKCLGKLVLSKGACREKCPGSNTSMCRRKCQLMLTNFISIMLA